MPNIDLRRILSQAFQRILRCHSVQDLRFLLTDTIGTHIEQVIRVLMNQSNMNGKSSHVARKFPLTINVMKPRLHLENIRQINGEGHDDSDGTVLFHQRRSDVRTEVLQPVPRAKHPPIELFESKARGCVHHLCPNQGITS